MLGAGGFLVSLLWRLWQLLKDWLHSKLLIYYELDRGTQEHFALCRWMEEHPAISSASLRWRPSLMVEEDPLEDVLCNSDSDTGGSHGRDSKVALRPVVDREVLVWWKSWPVWLRRCPTSPSPRADRNDHLPSTSSWYGQLSSHGSPWTELDLNNGKIEVCMLRYKGHQRMRELILEGKRLSSRFLVKKTQFFRVSGNQGYGLGGRTGCSWVDGGFRLSRPIKSVILDGTDGEDIFSDVQEFLRSEQWYAGRGLPYRRVLAARTARDRQELVSESDCGGIPSDHKMPVYILSMALETLNDEGLNSLFSSAAQKSIILLEDIDSTRRRFLHNDLDSGRTGASISLEGLLNAIDGVDAQESRIVFMTCNNIEALDPALIRPGRIDYQLKFGKATRFQLSRLFKHFYENDLRAEFTASKLDELADLFATAFPEASVTTAEAMSHLLRKSPFEAVDKLVIRSDTKKVLDAKENVYRQKEIWSKDEVFISIDKLYILASVLCYFHSPHIFPRDVCDVTT
ncbi:hypothetical protein GUITHDRAFT_111783 [Guillardia theta CCMP2712]|uniref:ATPase AAA-type core domain-containing protein n=1 Tax=Guillardia theta (strain CCMP2712) TaxID=905079 RepID=L1J2A0_GUITC|nr:hypothetical protein GUITHDRAFT_111783 [Guillardia theta CCMP2712]EKX42220.1 hypothetical protein GUITHDRAFT_111783 [Guillardia theta CCMP2712]|eukprot:XP_005829200.1 hypothetical protein GUITHDRAFT_111783 [Guillardia theta CCMP2712]